MEPVINLENLNLTPTIASISLNEEIQICNDGNVDIRECEREIDEFYDKIILKVTTSDKRDNTESMGIAKDNLVNTNINTSYRSGSGWNDDGLNYIEQDYNEFKSFTTGKLFSLRNDLDILINKNCEKTTLENENKMLRTEVSDLRNMVKDLVESLCSRNIEVVEDDAKINQKSFSRRNHSNGTNQKITDKNTPKEINNTNNDDLSKWLLPKRFIPPINLENDKVKNTIELNDLLNEKHKNEIINNGNINESHLGRKGLHLNRKGIGRLALNFIYKLKYFFGPK